MAFLFKVFSGSERLKEKQKSAHIVNQTFQAELKDVQSKLEVENYELQMLVEMIYDSSFPESQKFLKQPSTDRLYAHKETISSLLFGLAAQGVPVAPSILTHFQKYGCEAIADTLVKLLELVRPLLASKDTPEFTSDDILDAIDIQWHSSVRSSPAFGSVRGSRAQSPLQSPRGSVSLLSPRLSISSPPSPFSIEKVFGSSRGQLSPHGLTSPRKTQSFSFSPPSALRDTGWDRASATPPRRSLSSHYPANSDTGLYSEKLQPLAEHDEETNNGFGKLRKRDDGSAESASNDEANSGEKVSSHEADEDNALSRIRPQSPSISGGADGNDHTAVESVNDFPTADHSTLAPVLSHSLSLNSKTGQFNKALSINIPRSALSFEVDGLNRVESAGRAQVADDRGNFYANVRVKKNNETFVGFLPLGLVRSRSNSFDSSRLVSSHEQSDKSVQDVNAEAPLQKSWDKLESNVLSPDSLSSSNRESQISEEDIGASSFSLPIIRNHVEDSEQRVTEMNGEELNPTDDSITFEEGVKEDNLHLSEERVGVIKTTELATSQVAEKIQLQSASYEHDECEVQESKDSESLNGMSHDSSVPTRDEENVVAVTDSPHMKEVEGESLEAPALSSLVECSELDAQKEISPARNIQEKCETLVAGTNSENTPLVNGASSLKITEVEKFPQGELSLPLEGAVVLEQGSSSWLEQSSLIQAEGFEYRGDAGLTDNIQNEMDEAEDTRMFLLGVNNEDRDGVMDGVEGDEDKDENFSSMLSSTFSVEDDKFLVSVEDKEESYSSRVGPIEEHLKEKLGIQTEGEVEAQEPPHSRDSTAEVGTDILSQSSFSDYSDDDGSDESSSSSSSSPSSSSSSSSFSSSSSSDDESSSSTSTSSSDQRRSSSSSDDDTDDESSLPVTDLGEDVDFCSVENGEQHLFGRDSSGILSESKTHEAEETDLDEHINDPELDLEQGAALHSPSYNLVTFDLKKLCIDNNEDTSSCFSLQSEDYEVPGVTSEEVVTTKPSSCDGLDIISVNYSMGKGSISPSKSAISLSTVPNGASLRSSSSQRQYEDGIADDNASEVVPSSSIDESQNFSSSLHSDAGVSEDHPLDSNVAKRSSAEQMEDTEGADSVTLHSETVSDEGDWFYLSEVETKEHKDSSHRDSDLHVNDGESETVPPSQNVLEVDLRMKESEPPSPQQLPIHSGNQQVACVNDSLLSLSSDVVTHGSIGGEFCEDGSPSKDLVQNESVTPSHVRGEEANDTELVVAESTLGGKDESFPVLREPDFQMAHIDSESFLSSKALCDHFDDSSTMGNRTGVSEHTEVNTSEDNHSQFAQNEVEQPVISDSRGSKSEDHLLHVEAEKYEIPTFASPEARDSTDAGGEFYALPSIWSEQYEANGSMHQSMEQAEEKGSGAITKGVNRGAEDTGDSEVSSNTNEKAAASSEEDEEEGALSDQDGPNSADSNAEGDQIDATDHASIQLLLSENEDMLAQNNEIDLKEHAIPGTSSSSLSSTVDGDDGNSPVDRVDEVHDSECQDHKSKLAEGATPNVVQVVENVGAHDCETGELKLGTDVNLLQRGEVSILIVDSSESALFESQSNENSGRDDVLQCPEHEHLLLAGAGVAGANYPTPSKSCDGIMPSPVEHEYKPDNEKHMVVHEDEVSLPAEAEEVECQGFKQGTDGVNFKMPLHGIIEENSASAICDATANLRNDERETSHPTEYVDEDGKHPEASSEVFKLSGDDNESSRSGYPLSDINEFFDRIPPASEDLHPVNGVSQQFLSDSVLLEKEEELPIVVALLEESRKAPFENEEIGEASELVNGIQNPQVVDSLTAEEAHECETNNKNKSQLVEKETDMFLITTEPAIEGKTEPILYTLERGMEHDKKDNETGFFTGPSHTTEFSDSRGTLVRALTLPVTMARPRSEISPTPVAKFRSPLTEGCDANRNDTRGNHQSGDEKADWASQEHADCVETTALITVRSRAGTQVLQSGPELHSIHDSIICTPAYPRRWARDQQGTYKNVWHRKRCNILRALCCSFCSKCSTL